VPDGNPYTLRAAKIGILAAIEVYKTLVCTPISKNDEAQVYKISQRSRCRSTEIRKCLRFEYAPSNLLRTVRQVLGVPVTEAARKAGVNRSVVFRLEESEARQSITLRSMTRIAQALDCKVVYALIPRDGGTLEEMADRRKWGKYFGVGNME
jgi:DNA-binding Xre family transcriptional regulator